MDHRAKRKKGKAEAKRRRARKSPKDPVSKVRDLEKRLAEALEQQTATAEILRVISRSPTDLQPVLDTVAGSAARLCEAIDALIVLEERGALVARAFHGRRPASMTKGFLQGRSYHGRGSVVGRAFIDRRAVHVRDLLDAAEEFPEGHARALAFGDRTVLGVPLLREGKAIGVILIRRTEVRPFSDTHIALLQTFADQAVIAIENARLFNEMKEALERQTATGEILRVISSSPTDTQPVFDAIARNAVALCGGIGALVLRFDGEMLHVAGHHAMSPEGVELSERAFPRRPGRDYPPGRAFLDRNVVHVPDLQSASEFGASTARQRGAGSQLAVPLLHEGKAIGVIGLARDAVGPFSPQQIEMLETFADQAVIAIENVRLFKELEARNSDLTVALEQQTATSEILRVISSSPTDIQPVLDTVAENAARLCESSDTEIFRRDGDRLFLVAHRGPIPSRALAVPLIRGAFNGRAVLDGRTLHVADLQSETHEFPQGSEFARQHGTRAQLSVPLMREGTAIGTISLRRTEARLFTERQIALLQTFADQAVIAIENVRLFTELQASNRDLTTALDQQTATSDILRVISRSPTNVQPVFDAIVASAVRLLGAYSGALTRIVSDQIELAGFTSTDVAGDAAVRAIFPQPLESESPHTYAIRDRAPLNIIDAYIDPRVPEAGRAVARARGYRSQVVVPLLHHDKAVGTISLTRHDPGEFTDDEIALLQTFADQAVIAIENVRLFKELESRTGELTRSVDQLTALGAISQAVSSTLDVETVLETIVSRASQLAGADGCAIYEYDDATEVFHIRATHNLDPVLVGTLRAAPLRKGEGAMGRAGETREPIQVADIAVPGAYQSHIRDTLLGAGYRALLSVPLLLEDKVIGSLSLNRHSPGEFPAEAIEVLKTFATQSALAIQNARLFREIADKSAQLEAASRHKSEFLANMSHELRTPLNAIIGFSEVLVDRMFGELNEKQDEYLKDIYASGQHLLSLINDILDLSKIEAGRMELEVSDFDLPGAIDNALILVRERATRRGITLGRSVDERLGPIRGDERKVKQVLLNLLSNALKFTPEGGRIDVSARVQDGVAEIAVTDTGVGIAPEDQEAVFEEFRQVGTAEKKVEGTGLGLALSQKFVELHGGRIWVKSQVGQGSTFTFTLPVRREG